jgi:hypothetical protein
MCGIVFFLFLENLDLLSGDKRLAALSMRFRLFSSGARIAGRHGRLTAAGMCSVWLLTLIRRLVGTAQVCGLGSKFGG